jgi:hypothetical protein
MKSVFIGLELRDQDFQTPDAPLVADARGKPVIVPDLLVDPFALPTHVGQPARTFHVPASCIFNEHAAMTAEEARFTFAPELAMAWACHGGLPRRARPAKKS